MSSTLPTRTRAPRAPSDTPAPTPAPRSAPAPRDAARPAGFRERLARRALLARLARLEVGELAVHEPGRAAPTILRGTRPAPLGPPPPRAALHVRDPAFWLELFGRGSLGAAEAYVDGLWQSPDLTALVRLMVRNRDVLEGLERGPAKLLAPLRRLWALRRRNTRAGSRRNIAAHYDLGNDFFALFLDPTMTYSAGVFEHADADLEAASVAKIDRLCRKLDLRPEHHLLEIGTGWGALAVHAARHYGCRVTTTTLSREQLAAARERVRAAGLEHRVELLLADYRELTGTYDRVVSVEMVEAVGADFLPEYLRTCMERLRPDGLFAMQAIHIADDHYERALREVDFIKRHVFPGSFIPSISAITGAMAARTDFRLVHLEDFGPHYARTLRAWRERLAARRDEALAGGRDERFLRLWDYYLCYCEGGFAERFLGVAQLLFARPLNRREPLLPPRDALAPPPAAPATTARDAAPRPA